MPTVHKPIGEKKRLKNSLVFFYQFFQFISFSSSMLKSSIAFSFYEEKKDRCCVCVSFIFQIFLRPASLPLSPTSSVQYRYQTDPAAVSCMHYAREMCVRDDDFNELPNAIIARFIGQLLLITGVGKGTYVIKLFPLEFFFPQFASRPR